MKKIILIPVVILILITTVYAASMSRTVPSTADTGQSFTVTYNVDTTGLSTNWVVLLEDTVTGGCNPSTYRTGKFSDDTRPYTQVFTAPSTAGTCTFSGNYQFVDSSGVGSTTNFPTQSITISSGGTTCTWTSWQNDKCGGGTCSSNEMRQTRTVTPAGCASTSQCVTSTACKEPVIECALWEKDVNGVCELNWIIIGIVGGIFLILFIPRR